MWKRREIMMIDGNGEWFPIPDDSQVDAALPLRLDSLLPSDGDTGAVSHNAFRVALGALIDLMGRHAQPLTLLAIAADSSDTLRFLGESGVTLIGSAIARCLRQETRVHDIVGRADSKGACGSPEFLMVCPLMTEPLAAQFAERLREAMTLSAADRGTAWLTLSVGVASLSLDTQSADALIRRAEEALASAQRAGGGRVWSHTDSIRRIIERNQPDSLQE
jgi:two-component system cell cycle response regulator